MRTLAISLALATVGSTALADTRSEQFYLDVGRPDLAHARARRHGLAVLLFANGAAATALSGWAFARATTDPPTSKTGQVTCTGPESCTWTTATGVNGDISRSTRLGAGLLVFGALTLGMSAYLFSHPEPISDDEAAALEADANRRCALRISPVASPNGGGLVVAGRF
jgi:hypothetical protein